MSKASDDTPLLARIAAQIKRMAIERAQSDAPEERERAVRHIFTQGAIVDVKYTTDANGKPMWKMRVARDGAIPSDVEMKIFRTAFDVPGIFINDAPQQWLPRAGENMIRYARVIRWHARETQERLGV